MRIKNSYESKNDWRLSAFDGLHANWYFEMVVFSVYAEGVRSGICWFVVSCCCG